MGNENNSENEDILYTGKENVYVFGDGIDKAESFNLSVINDIFSVTSNTYGTIKLTDSNTDYYNPDSYFFFPKKVEFSFQGENKTKIDSKWNCFTIPISKFDREFANTLFFHLYEKDIKNSRNNVIVCFLPSIEYNEYEQIILETFDNLKNKSYETLPIIIFIGGKKVNNSDKLEQINYLPGFNQTNEDIIIKSNGNLSQKEITKLVKEAQTNYLRSKLARIDYYYNQRGYNLNLLNPLQTETQTISTNLTICLVGASGAGKSTFINLNFDELVARVSTSSRDVTIKCSEFLLPPKQVHRNNRKIGQIRFIDCPGMKEEKNYYEIVKPELLKKIKEFQDNYEQIDVALFFISNGNERECSKADIDLIKILHKYKIKIIFVINGDLSERKIQLKKQKIQNEVNSIDRNIISDDLSNIIFTNFTMDKNEENPKYGISKIWEKILSYIKVPDDIKVDIEKNLDLKNYNEKFDILRRNSRMFEKFDSLDSMKSWAKTKANFTVTGFSLLAAGSSLISMFIPLVDSFITIGYEVGMLYSILSIYELNPDDYDKVSIILSTGSKINKIKKEVVPMHIKNEIGTDVGIEAVEKVVNAGVFAGKEVIKNQATKEAGKLIAVKTVETAVVENTVIAVSMVGVEGGLKFGAVGAEIATTKVVTKAVEKVAIQAGKEASELALKQGAQQVSLEIAQGAVKAIAIEATEEGAEAILVTGSTTTIKTVTEEIAIKQGGKAWLINLGKAVPFIGAGISAVMNTYSTGKLGYKLVKKFDEEFVENTTDFIKGKLYAVDNICEQIILLTNNAQ